MKNPGSIPKKIYTLATLIQQVERWKFFGKTIAFTNGCFDILHSGHIASLTQAAQYADVLVVGVNADASVRKLKGANRPVNDEKSRALLIASLAIVDAVVVFNDDTPLELIEALQPDVLVKGGDYKIEDIAGAKEVLSWGGQVFINPILPGFSTTAVISKIQKAG